MTPCYNTVTATLREYLARIMKCSAFDDFYLVGGTALSLQLGHRISVDIDLFTPVEYGSINLPLIKDSLSDMFRMVINIDSLDHRQMVYSLFVGDSESNMVKLDICYDEQPIFPAISADGIRMLSEKDIAAMKLLAIVTGCRAKDFWDIHELMQRYDLDTMIQWAVMRNPYTLDRSTILHSFKKVWELPEPDDIICMKHKIWPFVADELYTAARMLSENG